MKIKSISNDKNIVIKISDSEAKLLVAFLENISDDDASCWTGTEEAATVARVFLDKLLLSLK